MIALIMACSATKVADAGPLPALNLYDGPMWRSLRARLAEMPRAKLALEQGDLAVLALSAEHGFVPHSRILAPYEHKMTSSRAVELRNHDTTALARHVIAKAEVTCVAAGRLYAGVVHHVAPKLSRRDDFLTGRGIGMQRKLMSDWLRVWFGEGLGV